MMAGSAVTDTMIASSIGVKQMSENSVIKTYINTVENFVSAPKLVLFIFLP
jgi:hypothetical protein